MTNARNLMARLYADHLQTEGYPADVTPTNDVVFTRGGREYRLTIATDSLTSITIMHTFWRISSNEEQQHAKAAAKEMKQTFRRASISVSGDDVSAIVKDDMPKPGTFFSQSLYYLADLDDGIHEFSKLMTARLPRPPAIPFPITQRARAEAYSAHLTSLGYSPLTTAKNEVWFTHDGIDYYLTPDRIHDHIVGLSHRTAIVRFLDDAACARAAAAAEAVNASLRNGRICMSANSASGTLLMNLADPLSIRDEFAPCLTALNKATEAFLAMMTA